MMSTKGSKESVYFDFSDEDGGETRHPDNTSEGKPSTDSDETCVMNASDIPARIKDTFVVPVTVPKKLVFENQSVRDATEELIQLLKKEKSVEHARSGGECAEILLAGNNAWHVLECAIQQISRENGSSPRLVKVPKANLELMDGQRMQIFIKTVLLEVPFPEEDCILLFQDLPTEHILALNQSDFIRKTLLQIQPSIKTVVFLKTELDGIFDCFTQLDAHVILSYSHDDDDDDDNGSREENLDASIVPNPQLVPEQELELESLNEEQAVDHHEQRAPEVWKPSVERSKLPKIEEVDEKENPFEENDKISDSLVASGYAIEMQPKSKCVDNLSEKMPLESHTEPRRENFFCGIFHLFSEMMAQCGDCCFY